MDDPWEDFNDEPSFGDVATVPPSLDDPLAEEMEELEEEMDELEELDEEISEELLEEDGSMPPYKEEAELGINGDDNPEESSLEDMATNEEDEEEEEEEEKSDTSPEDTATNEEDEEEEEEEESDTSPEDAATDEEEEEESDNEIPPEIEPYTGEDVPETTTDMEIIPPDDEEPVDSIPSVVEEAPPAGEEQEEDSADNYDTTTSAYNPESPESFASSNFARDEDGEEEYEPPNTIEVNLPQDSAVADRWHTQDWRNKTPQELSVYAEEEADQLIHDKYVPLVAVIVAIACLGVLLCVVAQILEHPRGCVAKTCRCTVAIFRILTWPIRMILCCGLCCGSSSISSSSERKPDHELLGQTSDDMSFA